MQAASTLLEKRGAEGLTLRDVAKAAGVSHTAPYHHFKNMEEILATLAENAFAELVAELELLPSGGQADRLTMAGGVYFSFAIRHRALFRLMFGPLLAKNKSHAGLRRAAQKTFDTVFSFAAEIDEERAAVLTMTGWALSHGLATLALEDVFDAVNMQIPNLDEAIVEVAKTFMAMIAGRPEPARGPAPSRPRRK